VSLLLHSEIYQNYYNDAMCHLFTLCNISELLYLWNVSLLLHCAAYQNCYNYAMCHFSFTVQYIRIITITQCVTYTALCKISELLYLCNVSLLLHCAINQFYSHTIRTINYSLFTLRSVTSITLCSTSVILTHY